MLAEGDSKGIKTGSDRKFVTLSLQVGGMGSGSVSFIDTSRSNSHLIRLATRGKTRSQCGHQVPQ